MNKIFLIGRITKDTELKYAQNGLALLSFSVAVSRNYKNDKGEYDADFINCKAFDKRAETIAKYFGKGSQIGLEGHLQTGSYEGKDGKKVYTTDVIIDGVDFIGTKKSEEPNKQYEEVKPKKVEIDPFAAFGNMVSIDNDFLD